MTKATDAMRKQNTKHGMCNSSEYQTWAGAKKRFTNKSCKEYPRYGGRGIFVSDEWSNSFVTFLADMGPKPSPAHSLDRLDNDGPYSKENCRWATYEEQNRNRRSNLIVIVDGDALPLVAACEKLGAKYDLVNKRMLNGWSFDQAVGLEPKPPIFRQKGKISKVSASGYTGVYKFGKKWGVTVKADFKRYYLGLFESAEEASAAYLAAKESIRTNSFVPPSKAKIRSRGFNTTRMPEGAE